MHYPFVAGSLRAAITEGALRAVGIGRRNSFYAVALRYRVAYSLEHHNGFLGVLRSRSDTSRTGTKRDRRRGALSPGIIP